VVGPRSPYIYPALLCAIWVAMVIAVDPIGDFPLNDDWAWGGAVKTLYETHVLTIPGWADAAVVGQMLWGLLFCLPAGFSFTALRISTAVLGLAAVLATYGLTREVGASKGLAFLCAFAIAANPLIFESSNTFMTDTPFLAFLLLSVLCFVRTVRTPSLVTAGLAIVLALIATLTRQLGLVIPILFAVGCVVGRAVSVRNVVVAVAGMLIVHTGLQRFEEWLRASGQLSANYGRLMRVLEDRLRHPFDPAASVLTVGDGVRIVLTYVGFFLAPVLIAIAPRRLRTAKPYLLVGAALGLGFGWTAAVELGRRGAHMPFFDHFNLVDFGLGPITLPFPHLRGGGGYPVAGAEFWQTVTDIGLVGGGIIVLLVVVTGLELLGRKSTGAAKPGKVGAAMALAFVVGYGVVLFLMPFDRYFVPIFPMVLVAGVWGAEARVEGWGVRAISAIAFVGIVLQAGFSVAATHDYLAWNRARWEALDALMSVDGVPLAQIDGGFEFNGWYRYGSPTPPGKRPWVEDDRYIVTLGPVPGYRTFRVGSYPRWTAAGDGKIFVLVREQP